MTEAPRQIVIVGAAAAGISAAETLRESGYAGRLVMVGEEPRLAYDRPPLSKQVLLGGADEERIRLQPADFYARHAIDLRLGRRATALELSARRVRLDDGQALDFDRLLIATGLVARRLPGQADLRGTHTLRTWEDAMALRADLRGAARLLVVGAGVLGCEVAASARQLGLEVTLLDPMEAPMARQLGPRLGRLLGRLHQERGVDVRCGVGLRRLLEREGRFIGAELGDGSVLEADVLVAAIGSVPAVQWLRGSGLALDDGVMCDAWCRAADGIYAAGDVANWHSLRTGGRQRVEHRMNATEQGMVAARNMLGAGQVFDPMPYYWSDQHGVKLQGYGRYEPGAELAVVSGSVQAGKFAAAFVRQAVVTGVIGWNSPREVRTLRERIGHTLPAATA